MRASKTYNLTLRRARDGSIKRSLKLMSFDKTIDLTLAYVSY